MNEGWNVVVRHDPAFASVNVWLINVRGNKWEIVSPVNLTTRTDFEPSMERPEPTLKFSGHDAEHFLKDMANALVEAGYRPDELKSQDSQLRAVQYHLEDMRRLVFSKEGVNK